MARRKDSVLADLFAIAAKLPWQVSVACAVLSFIALHWIASQEPVTATSTGDIGSAVLRQIVRIAAVLGQAIVPMIFLAGAFAGVVAQRRRSELVTAVAASDSPSALSQMTWREFEALVHEAFVLRGYTVRRLGGDGPDGGVDLVLERGAEKTLVQCKQWRAQKVGVTVLRELYGVMAAQGASAGIVVTSGSFSRDAIDFAEGRNLQLIARHDLYEMIRGVRAAAPLPEGTTRSVSGTLGAPGCPRCGSPMVRRRAKRGSHSGEGFYGCSRFPACWGTRTM